MTLNLKMKSETPPEKSASDTTEAQPSTTSQSQPEERRINLDDPNSKPLQESLNESSFQAGSTEEPDHFDALLSGGGDDGGAALTTSGEKKPQLSEAEFVDFYAEIFGMASAGTGFKSLEISPEDRQALAAMHRRALASKYFNWMLTPGGPVMMDWVLIARFVGGKAKGVAEEVAAKQGAGQQPQQEQAQTGEPDIPHYNFSGGKSVQ